MKTLRKTIYAESFPYGARVEVQCVFDLKQGFRFLTILPNKGFRDRNPFKVIFRVLEFRKQFILTTLKNRPAKKLHKAFNRLEKKAGHCTGQFYKLACVYTTKGE